MELTGFLSSSDIMVTLIALSLTFLGMRFAINRILVVFLGERDAQCYPLVRFLTALTSVSIIMTAFYGCLFVAFHLLTFDFQG